MVNMEEYLRLLSATEMFAGLDEKEIKALSDCLSLTCRTYRAGGYVFHAGEVPEVISILSHGSLRVQKEDYWGNRTIVSDVKPGAIFGESYAIARRPLLNDIVAVSDSTVFHFSADKLASSCDRRCSYHARVTDNLMRSIASGNRALTKKIDCMSRRSIRGKLMAYLSFQSKKSGGAAFRIPFNRQQLADYLAVDRSALSKELCKMRDDGLLTFDKNSFRLID